MALSINTNIASLQAQNNLTQVNQTLQQNQERLSSGLRINSAADDAAGLAVSDRMTAQIKGMNQASRNANNGISMVQTAEGGMQQITDLLQRMRELAVQSANETATQEDRQSANQEFQQLSGEIDRIAQATTFNGKALLDGSQGIAKFQVGPDTGTENYIEVDMSTSMRSQDLGRRYEGTMGLNTVTGTNAGAATLTANELKVNGTTVDMGSITAQYTPSGTMPANGQVRTSAWGVAQAINNQANLDVNAQALTTSANGTAGTAKVADTATASGTATVTATATAKYTLSINDIQIVQTANTVTATNGGGGAVTATATVSIGAVTVADKINNNSDLNVTASVTANGNLVLNDTQGGNILVNENHVGNGTGTAIQGFFSGSATITQMNRGAVNLQAQKTIEVKDSGTADTEFTFGAGTTYNQQNSGLNAMDVASVTNAQKAIDKIDAALSDVDSFRGTMGAMQNRLEATVSNLQNASQNLTQARSRIRDADIAKEAAQMTMNNVRRQAAAAVLTQANQVPQLALQLLGR